MAMALSICPRLVEARIGVSILGAWRADVSDGCGNMAIVFAEVGDTGTVVVYADCALDAICTSVLLAVVRRMSEGICAVK